MCVGTSTAIVIAGAGTAVASAYAAHKNSSAAEDAATKQSQSNAEALAFQKQAAENDYKNQEVARKANYDQYVAKQTAMNQVRQGLGLRPVEIPPYVPSVDPTFTGTPISQTAGGVTPPDLQGADLGTMAGAGATAPATLTPQQRAQQYLRTQAAPTGAPNFLGTSGLGGTPAPGGMMPGTLGSMAQGPGLLPIDPSQLRDAQGNLITPRADPFAWKPPIQT
jgi:hypothetical protein